MKKYLCVLFIFFSILFLSESAFAQRMEGLGNVFVVNKQQFSFADDGSNAELDSLIKVYNENVIKKNEYIVSHKILVHCYGNDNRDYINVTEVKSWEDVLKVAERNPC